MEENDLLLYQGFEDRAPGELLNEVYEAGLSGSVFWCSLALFLALHENPFSLSMEKRERAGEFLEQAAMEDLERLLGRVRARGEKLKGFRHPCPEKGFLPRETIEGVEGLSQKLEKAENAEAALEALREFYRNYGVGIPGMYKAFRLEGEKLAPIKRLSPFRFSDLVGLEEQKAALKANTEAFLEGKRANNVLLYGDAGTGKSSCIKALANEYYSAGLRVVEVYRHELISLGKVIEALRNRNYFFILYMDDLSFEEFETEYKYLKAVIEGGLSDRPENVLIYATSNRRHLIRESFKDRQENDLDMHPGDTVQEKLSLSGRFGISLYFGRPNKKEYLHIVEGIADREGLELSREELHARANSWELSHGGRSGRAARQLVDAVRMGGQ